MKTIFTELKILLIELKTLLIELKTDYEKLYKYIIQNIQKFNKLPTSQKIIILILNILAIFPIYLNILIFYYIIKNLLKYIFIILDIIWKKIFNITYNNYYFIINNYLGSYLLIKTGIIYLDNYIMPNILNKILLTITNFFYIKFYFKLIINKIRKAIDNKLLKIYANLEFIFGFSYILIWKNKLDFYYIPILKKYLDYYSSNSKEKTKIYKKKINEYIIYIQFIKRYIFWLYIGIIYRDLFFTNIYMYIYFILWINPINYFIWAKNRLYLKYKIIILNIRELTIPILLIYWLCFRKSIITLLKYTLLNLTLIINTYIYILLKFIYNYTIYKIIYYFKVIIINNENYVELLYYWEAKIRFELYFFYLTIFLFTYKHMEKDLKEEIGIFFLMFLAYRKYCYFYITYSKVFFKIGIIHINLFIKDKWKEFKEFIKDKWKEFKEFKEILLAKKKFKK